MAFTNIAQAAGFLYGIAQRYLQEIIAQPDTQTALGGHFVYFVVSSDATLAADMTTASIPYDLVAQINPPVNLV